MARNRQEPRLEIREILRKKVLVLGEARSGKTKLAARLLRELTNLIDPQDITVIDLAPQRTGEIGGKITDYINITGKIRYYSPEKVYTPRLTGTSAQQVLHYAELNRKAMETILRKFIQNPTRVLAINDVTMFFHAGEPETVLQCVSLAETFFATAYYGSRLANDFGAGISEREKQSTDKLCKFMDLIVKIG